MQVHVRTLCSDRPCVLLPSGYYVCKSALQRPDEVVLGHIVHPPLVIHIVHAKLQVLNVLKVVLYHKGSGELYIRVRIEGL